MQRSSTCRLAKTMHILLVEALMSRGLPKALATGHGQDGIDLRYRTQSTLRKPFDFAAFQRTIDDIMAPSSAST